MPTLSGLTSSVQEAGSSDALDEALKEMRSMQAQHEKKVQDFLIRQEERIVNRLVEAIQDSRPAFTFPMNTPAVGSSWNGGPVRDASKNSDTASRSGEEEVALPGQMLESTLETTTPERASKMSATSLATQDSISQDANKLGKLPVPELSANDSAKPGRITQQLESIKSYKTAATVQDLDGESNHTCNLAVKIVNHPYFEICSCLAIFADSLLIGIEADMKMIAPLADTHPVILALNWMLIIGFTLELFLRMGNEGPAYYGCSRPNIIWNLFDTILVVSSWIEPLMKLGGASDTGIDISAMRMFRIMRMIRGLRLIRVVRFFKDLRVMLQGIFRSLQSLIWALLLLVCLMYMFAVCVLQFAVEEVSARELNKTSVLSDDEFNFIKKEFSSIIRTIFTLFQAILGGVDWGDVADPLLQLSGILGLLFVFYVAFATLCVLNIITGVFVDNANKIATKDDEMVMMDQLEQRQVWFKEVKELFRTTDLDDSGTVTAEEFATKMEDMRMQAWMRKIGVQVESYSAAGLFQLLDFDGDGELELEEFALALQSVHGNARSIDLAKVSREAKLMRKDLNQLCDLCNDVFERMMPGIRKVNVNRLSTTKNEETVFYQMEKMISEKQQQGAFPASQSDPLAADLP